MGELIIEPFIMNYAEFDFFNYCQQLILILTREERMDESVA